MGYKGYPLTVANKEKSGAAQWASSVGFQGGGVFKWQCPEKLGEEGEVPERKTIRC